MLDIEIDVVMLLLLLLLVWWENTPGFNITFGIPRKRKKSGWRFSRVFDRFLNGFFRFILYVFFQFIWIAAAPVAIRTLIVLYSVSWNDNRCLRGWNDYPFSCINFSFSFCYCFREREKSKTISNRFSWRSMLHDSDCQTSPSKGSL